MLSAVAITCLLALPALPGCTATILTGSQSSPVLKIGIDLPLSGDEGRVANPALNGIRFYVAQHPQLDGFSIQVDARDDTSAGTPDPARGAANVQALAGAPQVIAVIGPFDAAVARAEIPIANLASLAMVSPAISSPCLTKAVYLPATLTRTRSAVTCKDAGQPAAADLRPNTVNNFFRLAPTDDLQGPAAADYAFKSLHIVRAATVSDHEAYGQALARSFAARFVRLGGSIVGSLDTDLTASTVEATAFLRRMRADGAQALYFGGSATNRGCVLKSQMADLFPAGDQAPFLGGDGIAEDPACIAQVGSHTSAIYATVPAIDPANRAGAAAVIAAFKRAYPARSDYGAYTVIAYDAAGLLYAALHRAIMAAGGRLPPRSRVNSELAGTAGYLGVTGTIGFDPAGDTTNRVLSVYRAPGSDPLAAWILVGEIDFGGSPPY